MRRRNVTSLATGWSKAAAFFIVLVMPRMLRTSNRVIRSRPGQLLAWLAVGLLLLQMWGGAGFLMRLVAAEDSFALLSLQYLCTGQPADTSTDSVPVKDSKAGDHVHCLLCPDHVAPFLPIVLCVLLLSLAWCRAATIFQRAFFLVRQSWNASRSRAPPMTGFAALA
jgi:hypothetical protein